MVLLIVSAFVFILGMVMAVKAFLVNRAEEKAPFRDYYLPEHDRELLRLSAWSDDENKFDRQTRFEAFNTRDRQATGRYSRGSSKTWRNRDRD
jgi:hypothetical protein